MTLSHDAGYTGDVRTRLAQSWDTTRSLALSVFLSLALALPFSRYVCVCMLACVYEGGEELSPTAVVTQLCLVYISSDNSGSKHRSSYADVPLMAFKHVCGSACLYV